MFKTMQIFTYNSTGEPIPHKLHRFKTDWLGYSPILLVVAALYIIAELVY